MSVPHIIGWGHTQFGKLDQSDLEQLFRDAVKPALECAGSTAEEIDGIFVGTFNGGFVPQEIGRAHV